MAAIDSSPTRIARIVRESNALWVVYGILMLFSVIGVSSAIGSQINDNASYWPLIKHIGFLFVSFLLTWTIAYKVPVKSYRGFMFVYCFAVLISFVLLLLVGRGLNHAVRWLHIGPFSLQPSEFYKPMLIFLLSYAVYEFYKNHRSVRFLWYFFFFNIALVGYIASQNLSTGLLLGLFMAVFLWILKVPMRRFWFRAFGSLALLGLLGGLFIYKTGGTVISRGETWKKRIERVLNKTPEKEEAETASLWEDERLQENAARTALANGQVFGKGPGQSQMKNKLPMAFSDYIMNIIYEEYGILSFLIPILFIVWIYLCLKTAKGERSPLWRNFTLGVAIYYPMQALLNLVVASGFIVTGQTLPLVSVGGSALWSTSIAIGIVIGLSRRQYMVANGLAREEIKKEAEEVELMDQQTEYEDIEEDTL